MPSEGRKVHKQAIPRLGVAVVLLSFLFVIIVGFAVQKLSKMILANDQVFGSIILGSIRIFIIGFLGDLSRLAPKTKLIVFFMTSGDSRFN